MLKKNLTLYKTAIWSKIKRDLFSSNKRTKKNCEGPKHYNYTGPTAFFFFLKGKNCWKSQLLLQKY